MLAPEGELARAEPDREALLCLRIQLTKAVDHDGTLLGEAEAEQSLVNGNV